MSPVFAVALLVCAQESPARPLEVLDEGYAGAESCRDCHAANHASWSASYHRRMTQVASAESVLAPFPSRTAAFEGRNWIFAREGERFFATARAAQADAGDMGGVRDARREIVLTTGSHHYQIYWLADEGRGMEQLPLVWHRAEEQWVPRKAMFLAPPAPETGDETGRWEVTCIKCHATNGTSEHALGGTRAAAFGIACEACHGPGAAHVAWHRNPAHAEAEVPSAAELVQPATLDPVRSSAICAQCHAIRPVVGEEARRTWAHEGFAYRPGDDIEATRPLLRGRPGASPPALEALLARQAGLRDEYFWPDGEVRVSGREFNGLVESACYQRGELGCLACHEMHPGKDDRRPLAEWADDQLRPGMDGPRACLPCHAALAEPDALRAHAHHAPDSAGADCLNCHMPHTTWGLTKSIRSHAISSPSAAVELATGRPSACTLCHLDRPLGWTADKLSEWCGHERPALDEERERVAASVRYALRGDAGARALMAAAYGWGPARAVSGTGWMPFVLSTLLMDDYDAVRWTALRAARLDPRYSRFELDFLLPLEEQRNAVREHVLSDWLEHGLTSEPAQRAALLLRPDGALDEARFRALYAERDLRPVRLSE